ncbi:MAG TPA: redoxin domain-containing protein [Acidimicrobiales bacterium]|nr:redoxin domain-containing protein [Acidimicrobiales bacterium]
MSTRRRRAHVARWSAIGVLVVIASLVAVLGTRGPATEQLMQSPLLGKLAPPLAGPALVGGRPVALSSYRHRWVLVNFFASWCTVCQEEEPQLERFLYSRPGGVRPVVLGVLYGDTRADGIAFQRAEGATWPSVDDPNGVIASAWGVASLPRSYLVAPDGRIVACILGGITASQLDALVAREIARPAEQQVVA